VKQAFGYRAGSSVYGPFGSKFADDEHSSTSLSLKCAHDIASTSLHDRD
jgi:hypothetical protein